MSEKSLFAIVLAAGTASRFGSTKQLALFAGQALVTHAVRTAESVCGSQTLLVTGSDWQNVADASEPLLGFMVLNPKYACGIASSLVTGIRSVSAVADAALLMLADQPLVTIGQIEALIDTWKASPDSICASAYADTLGPPVIFPSRLFGELMKLQGDRGAKSVIDSNSDSLITVRAESAAIDIDCPGDLTKIGSEP